MQQKQFQMWIFDNGKINYSFHDAQNWKMGELKTIYKFLSFSYDILKWFAYIINKAKVVTENGVKNNSNELTISDLHQDFERNTSSSYYSKEN